MNYHFLKIYFGNAAKLLDVRFIEQRDITLFFNYLESLHATHDKLKAQFDVDIASYPEFILLREIRNYFHHVGDVEHTHFWSNFSDVLPSAVQQIVVPVSCVAKALINYRDKCNNVKESKKRKHLEKVQKDFECIKDIYECQPLFDQMDIIAEKPYLCCDGEIVELGFDLFKCVYNVTNIIADICRHRLSSEVFAEFPYVDDSFTSENNIGKWDLVVRPGSDPILTIRGYIFPSMIEKGF